MTGTVQVIGEPMPAHGSGFMSNMSELDILTDLPLRTSSTNKGAPFMRLEEILLVIALVVAFAIAGTMDAQDAELSASASHPSLQQQVKP